MTALDDAIRDAALSLPASLVEALAVAIASFDQPTARSLRQVVGANRAPNFRARAAATHAAWEPCADAPGGPEIAAALRAAAAVAHALRSEQTIEIAWTGPMTADVPLRRTREILISLA